MCVAEGRSTATARKGFYALYLSAVIALSHEPAVLAQALGSKTLAANIPPEPLSQALEDFAHQTDIQVVYLSDVVADQKTRGAPAQLKPTDALVYLLEGTGLRFEFLNTRIVRVVVAGVRPDDVLAEIVVTAQVKGVRKPPHFAPPPCPAGARAQDATLLPLYAASRPRLAERIASYRQLLAGGFGINAIDSGDSRRSEYRARQGICQVGWSYDSAALAVAVRTLSSERAIEAVASRQARAAPLQGITADTLGCASV